MLVCCCFVSYCVARLARNLMILPHQPFKSWDYKCVLAL